MPALLALLALLAAAASGSISFGATSVSTDDTADDDAPDEMEDMPEGDAGDHDGHDMPDTSAGFTDITAFGVFHGTSSHTMGDSLDGGRTAITTEAMLAYNGLRDFLGLDAVDLDAIGTWAFANDMTNNDEAYGQDIEGVGLYYGMQGAKVGWIRDDAFDPQLLADIQLAARSDQLETVMEMVDENGLAGFGAFLESEGLVETFINTLKMEPHYGGWMHGRTHGDLSFDDETGAAVATAHDLNHLTVLSHDQTQPFMNDTFDYPQWPALEAPEADVANYYQSIVTLGDPQGPGITSAATAVVDGDALMAMLATDVLDEELPGGGEAEPEVLALF